MKTRVLVGVICLPALFAILFWAPPVFFTILVSLICAISAIELIQAAGMPKNIRVRIYIVLSAAIIPISVHYSALWPPYLHLLHWMSSFLLWAANNPYFFPFLITFLMFIEAAIAYKTDRQISINMILATIFGAAIMPQMLSTLVEMRFISLSSFHGTILSFGGSDIGAGRYFILIPIICAFFTDAGAYFSGFLFGKRKAFPHISPKKTVAGCVGGLITGALMLVLFGTIINFATQYHANVIMLAIIGIVGAAFTQLGDLAFSLIKREYNVKDFGKLIPGHGGMLDRFDSLFFVAPVIYLMITSAFWQVITSTPRF